MILIVIERVHIIISVVWFYMVYVFTKQPYLNIFRCNKISVFLHSRTYFDLIFLMLIHMSLASLGGGGGGGLAKHTWGNVAIRGL